MCIVRAVLLPILMTMRIVQIDLFAACGLALNWYELSAKPQADNSSRPFFVIAIGEYKVVDETLP